ncbi:transposable element Tcb2 transposase [Trichonephila clavipes]|nr:transposable element Tcb2 transposase [Trichonephila clavipes]
MVILLATPNAPSSLSQKRARPLPRIKLSKATFKPKSSVSDTIVKWKCRGSETVEKRTGRPKILGERSRRTLKRVVKQNRKSSLVEISQEFPKFISVSTAHKPNITPQNAKHRLQWCRAHRHWTVDMWKTVLWRDESRFTVWQSDGERFFSDCIVPTVKLGGGSIMVWGCFSWFGLGPLVPVIRNMSSEIYVDILDNAALPTVWQYFGEGPFLFQQDNCSIHTLRLAQTWFDEMGVQKLDWLSQSPDLNPIEYL